MRIPVTKIVKSLVIAILVTNQLQGQLMEDKKSVELKQMVENAIAFKKNFTGFALFDPETSRFLCESNAEKYFIPASNTKIFTFYVVHKVLGDSIPVLRYMTIGDSLIFWGTGNPMFLNPKLPPDSTVLTFLKNRPEKLFFSGHNFNDDSFAPGWSWEDYTSSYQPERSPFPIYGNQVIFERKEVKEGFSTYPAYFKDFVTLNARLNNSRPRIIRRWDSNIFEYNPRAMTGVPFRREIAFRYTPDLVAQLLTDTLKRQVGVLDVGDVKPQAAHTLSVPIPDTLLRKLMQDSDNFIAEQLLMACAEKLFGSQCATDAVAYASENLLTDVPEPFLWQDGSGLSRYNLFSPRTVAATLYKLYQEIPEERLKGIFPAGGVSGTIKDNYKGKSPYVFAKTGTLSGVHCLSGYIITQKGKMLIFSFMHNNFTGGSNPLKMEMEKILKWVTENY